ncbi:MAG: hypothetical protein HOQ45_08890 [Nocardioidaceae bacterium]|nr:hypothetical protein [Nocardioidaceae bacterium]
MASAVGVAAVFVGVGLLSRPTTPAVGPGPDTLRPQLELVPPRPDLDDDAGLASGLVEITGYKAAGRVLSLFYSVDVRDCIGRIQEPLVEETAQTVTVEIHRVRGARGAACGRLTLRDSVDVTLARPLAARLVQDGVRDDALVPPKEAVP